MIKLKMLSTTMILLSFPMTQVFAAALDRSGQSMGAFLQPGHYFEAGISFLDPNVSGNEAGTSNQPHRPISDMAEDYYFPSAALKVQATEKVSFGILYDQPFGAAAKYTGENAMVANPGSDTILGQATLDNLTAKTQKDIQNLMQPHVVTYFTSNAVNPATATDQQKLQAQGYAASQADVMAAMTKASTMANAITVANGFLGTGNTNVDVTTENLAFVVGYQPISNINIYAGGVYQTIKGEVDLRGQAYSLFNGYNARLKKTSATGWLAGIAYQIPEIALKASLTYRSEIDHEMIADEKLSLMNFPAFNAVLGGIGVDPAKIADIYTEDKTTITTPQSVNLDLQTGIMANTVAFANLRWVEWSKFAIQPDKFGKISQAVGPLVGRPDGFNLVQYADDQISATLGVGRKFSEQWAGNVSVGWDSGAGNPVSTLGPTEGYWNVGVGAQFSPTPHYFIAGGVKYFMLGDAKAQTGAQAGSNEYIAEFKSNDAWAYGLKVGYRF